MWLCDKFSAVTVTVTRLCYSCVKSPHIQQAVMTCNVACEYGFYCDSGTNRCETCHSICDPLRRTEYTCCRQAECRGEYRVLRVAYLHVVNIIVLLSQTSKTGALRGIPGDADCVSKTLEYR